MSLQQPCCFTMRKVGQGYKVLQGSLQPSGQYSIKRASFKLVQQHKLCQIMQSVGLANAAERWLARCSCIVLPELRLLMSGEIVL